MAAFPEIQSMRLIICGLLSLGSFSSVYAEPLTNANATKQQFIAAYGVQEVVPTDRLFTNPYPYKDKIAGICVRFWPCARGDCKDIFDK